MILIRNLTILLLLGAGLFFPAHAPRAADSFKVVASIKPIHSILAGLMEGTSGPELLITGNNTPYDFEPDSDELEHLSGARMVVWVGPELEHTLVEPIGDVDPAIRVITLLDSLELKVLPSRWNDTDRDPYFWLDSRNAIILIDELAIALSSEDPGRAHLYKRNRDKLLLRMAELDRKLEYGYRGLKSGLGLSYYDTQQYFEQAYALKVRGILARSPLQPEETVALLEGRAKLMSGDYSCLLTESGMPMSNFSLLANGAKINIGGLDSFGTRFKPGKNLYFDMMNHNTSVIKNCLRRGDAGEIFVSPGGVTGPTRIGGKFLLIDQNGELFTDADMLGRYQLIYFGYIFCPDICPTALQVSSRALDLLGERANRIQPYFITIDPERDTVDVVKSYVEFFSERLIGLTGTMQMIERVTKQYNVKYEKVFEQGVDPDMYAMDHTASLFLIAPDGRFITKFAHGISSEQLVEKLNQYIP